MNDLNDLLPIRILSLAIPDEKYNTRLNIVNKLVANNGDTLLQTNNGKWAKHIAESANAMLNKQVQYVMTRNDNSEIICCLEIPGIPVERKDWNIIKKNKDGTFVIGANKEHSDRNRYIMGEAENIKRGNPKMFPIDCPANTEFIFYIRKKRKHIPSLSSLVDAGLDELSKIAIIHGKTIRHISGTNGSRIVPIAEGATERTQVIIRRMGNGY